MRIIKKKIRVWAGLLGLLLLTIGVLPVRAQVSTGQDMQQLLLDIEKLTQFRAILSDMKTGYTMLTQGYGMVKDLSEGNFNLHSAFLNSLMAVSPEVRKYGRIADIIADQSSIVSEYQSAWKQAKAGGRFNASELLYLNSVFSQLLSQSADNLTNLLNVLTANSLRMNDAERLRSIDGIYSDTQSKLVFLRHFNSEVGLLSLQRAKEQEDVNSLKHLFP